MVISQHFVKLSLKKTRSDPNQTATKRVTLKAKSKHCDQTSTKKTKTLTHVTFGNCLKLKKFQPCECYTVYLSRERAKLNNETDI